MFNAVPALSLLRHCAPAHALAVAVALSLSSNFNSISILTAATESRWQQCLCARSLSIPLSHSLSLCGPIHSYILALVTVTQSQFYEPPLFPSLARTLTIVISHIPFHFDLTPTSRALASCSSHSLRALLLMDQSLSFVCFHIFLTSCALSSIEFNYPSAWLRSAN